MLRNSYPEHDIDDLLIVQVFAWICGLASTLARYSSLSAEAFIDKNLPF